MAQGIINTGNYRIYRDKTGIPKSFKVLKEGDKDLITQYWETMEKDTEFNYYCEEEIKYRGSLFDENKKPIDSAPSWRKISLPLNKKKEEEDK